MVEEGERCLFPQVQWAQRKHMIILRVLVKPVEVWKMCSGVFNQVIAIFFQTPKFTIRADYMTFKGEYELQM